MSAVRALADELAQLLALPHPAVAVTIDPADPPPGPAVVAPASEPAGCCFWHPAEQRTLDTGPADHSGCSVGSYTHGLLELAEAAAGTDTAALVDSGWVTTEDLAAAPRLPVRPSAIRYGPLRDAEDPDVVLIRVPPATLTTLMGACPDLLLVGKPQCQIVPLAHAGSAAVSPGCAISRRRTGLPADELTVALPAGGLPQLLAELRRSTDADQAVVAWADQHDRTSS